MFKSEVVEIWAVCVARTPSGGCGQEGGRKVGGRWAFRGSSGEIPDPQHLLLIRLQGKATESGIPVCERDRQMD